MIWATFAFQLALMFLRTIEIDPDMLLFDIVDFDYRTASVFIKYELSYSKNSLLTLRAACSRKKIDLSAIKMELERVIIPCQSISILPFGEWSIDFLVDYIIHIHHYYLKSVLPVTDELLKSFIKTSPASDPKLEKVELLMEKLNNDILPHIHQEESSIFPYIKQVARAYQNKESFGKLLVKTLGKPIINIMRHEQSMVSVILEIRELTDNYNIPAEPSIDLKVILNRLKEFDFELTQHIYLESEIIFPKIIQIEKELLKEL
jgi:regulator of cell morphogenesis and NO signaling